MAMDSNWTFSNESHIEKGEWDGFQRELGEWADKTFPQSTPETILAHFQKEVKELLDAELAKQPSEIADCVMLLMHLCHKKKLSLRDEIRSKLAICRARKWGKPDVDGVIEHVRE